MNDKSRNRFTANTELVSVRLPHQLAAQLRELARQRDSGPSTLIVEFVKEGLEQPAEQTSVQAV